MKFIALNDEIGNEIFVNADRIVTMRDRFGKTELYLSTDKQITVIESVSESVFERLGMKFQSDV